MRKREEQPALKLIERYTKARGLTCYELAELLKINVRNVRPYLKILAEQKRVFVEDWKASKNGKGSKIAVWRLNEYEDESEPYPKPPSCAERNRIYRKRKHEHSKFEACVGTGAAFRS